MISKIFAFILLTLISLSLSAVVKDNYVEVCGKVVGIKNGYAILKTSNNKKTYAPIVALSSEEQRSSKEIRVRVKSSDFMRVLHHAKKEQEGSQKGTIKKVKTKGAA